MQTINDLERILNCNLIKISLQYLLACLYFRSVMTNFSLKQESYVPSLFLIIVFAKPFNLWPRNPQIRQTQVVEIVNDTFSYLFI